MLLNILPRFIRDQIPRRYYPNIHKALLIFVVLFFIYVAFFPSNSIRVDDRGPRPVDYKNYRRDNPSRFNRNRDNGLNVNNDDDDEDFNDIDFEYDASDMVMDTFDFESDSLSDLDACLEEWGRLHEDVPEDMNLEDCPYTPPDDLLDNFTMNGRIEVHHWYKCQTGPKFNKRQEYTVEQIEEQIARVSARMPNYYGITDLFLYESIDNYPFKGGSVVVMGSQRPIYESVCYVFGASSCTTIDFQTIVCNDPRFEFITIAEYDQNPKQFDAAISISSFEHDGLGRYGDPMRPNGDIDMMKKMKCIVKPGGYLYLSVPIAKDKIVWNMHRVYGRIRLPELIRYWKLEEVYGTKFEMVRRYTGCDAGGEGDFQPIFVLKNEIPEEGHNERVLSEYISDELDGKEYSCFG